MWLYPGLGPGHSVLKGNKIITGNVFFSQFSGARKEGLLLLKFSFSLTPFFLPLTVNFLCKT